MCFQADHFLVGDKHTITKSVDLVSRDGMEWSPVFVIAFSPLFNDYVGKLELGIRGYFPLGGSWPLVGKCRLLPLSCCFVIRLMAESVVGGSI